MGNHRFRLSDMIPNAWFYKLKDMSKSRTRNRNKQYSHGHNDSSQHHHYHFRRSSSTTTTTISSKNNKSSQQTSNRTDCKFYNSPVNTKSSDIAFPCDPPRKSSSISSKNRLNKSRRRTIYRPSSILADNALYYSSSPLDSFPEDDPDFRESLLSESDDEGNDFLVPGSLDIGQEVDSWSSSCQCKLNSSTTDIIFDMNDEYSFDQEVERNNGFVKFCEVELPPILTKSSNISKEANGKNNSGISTKRDKIRADNYSMSSSDQRAKSSVSAKVVKEDKSRSRKEQRSSNSYLGKKSPSNSTGIKIRSNSPRIASKKIQACARKSTSISRNKNLGYSSCAVVKSSMDPLRDFKDSMLEMIAENNIKGSKDLEDLLACYLSLNSNEYHELIVQAFEQIWFYMT